MTIFGGVRVACARFSEGSPTYAQVARCSDPLRPECAKGNIVMGALLRPPGFALPVEPPRSPGRIAAFPAEILSFTQNA